MAEGAPSPMALWPKLRRRASRGCKSGTGKGKQNPFASRGLEKLAVVYTELQALRDSMAEKVGAPVSMARFLSRSARSLTTASLYRSSGKGDTCKAEPCIEELAPVVAEVVSGAECKESDRGNAVGRNPLGNAIVENSEEAHCCDGDTKAMASSTGSSCNSELISREVTSIVDMTLRREISLRDAFPVLPVRGSRAVGRRRQPVGGRERRCEHTTKTAVALIVTVGAYFAKKAADLGVSVLAALSFGVVIRRWRTVKQLVSRLFSAIARYLREPLQSYLSALATKRLSSSPRKTEEGKDCIVHAEARISPPVTIHRRNPSFVFPVLTLDVSPPSPSMRSPASKEPPPSSPAAYPSIRRETKSAPVSPVVSPRSSTSSPPSSSGERSPLRANKLSQFKAKIFSSFPLNKAASRERDLAFSVPSSPISEGGHEFFSRSERWHSDISFLNSEAPDARPLEDRVVKKKKSLFQRRSLSRTDDSGSEGLDSRSSGLYRSRFPKLRINISHPHDEPDANLSGNSPRTLRLGKLRISTSMRESPRRTEEDKSGSSSRPCSPGHGRLRVSFSHTERSKNEPSTPRKSGLSVVSTLPVQQEESTAPAVKKHQGHEAWLVVILLVSLIFLLIGRVPAVLATSFSFLFFSQFDKFKQSGGAGRNRGAATRAVEASRKLRKSPPPLSPRLISPCPVSPRSPSSGSPRSSIADVFSNECRKRIGMDSLFERGKKGAH